MTADLPVFTIRRTFNAPRELVWKAWTQDDMLSKWVGPKGGKCTVLYHELRAGGILHSRMDMAGAPPMWGKFIYQEVTRPSKLVWLHAFSNEAGTELTRHPFAPEWPLQLLTTVTFAENGDATDVELQWTPYDATPNEVECFRKGLEGMHQGWGGSFEKLDDYLAKREET